MTFEELKQKMLEYFEDNEGDFADVLSEMDGWDGYLNGEVWYPMYDFDDLHYGLKPSVLADRITSEFTTSDCYFKYDSNGDLVSSDYLDYDEHLDLSTMSDIYNYYQDNHVTVPSEVEDMIAEFDSQEEEEDEE